MAETVRYAPGTFCWVDLATTDTDSAKSFYGAVLGWTAEDMPVGDNWTYTMLRYGDRQAAALYPLGPEQGPRPYWSSYIYVDDVDGIAERAVELGADILMAPMDVTDAGRMCFLRDPTDAVFGLWQPKGHLGAEIDNEVGARCWDELQTRNPTAAALFYGRLFGWTSHTSPDLMEGTYTIFEQNGRPIAGMVEIQPSWGPVEPGWAVYFGVADCDGAIAAATRLGATLVMDPMDVDKVGRFAFLTDPQGALFAIIQRSGA